MRRRNKMAFDYVYGWHVPEGVAIKHQNLDEAVEVDRDVSFLVEILGDLRWQSRVN